jgi:soluble lytic murein transglycosylase
VLFCVVLSTGVITNTEVILPTDLSDAQIEKLINSGGVLKDRRISNAKLVVKIAKEYGQSPLLMLSMALAESNLMNNARSPAGARGIMQLLPSTAIELCKQTKMASSCESKWMYSVALPWSDSSVEFNIRLGVIYFSKLMKDFKNETAAIIAYNEGPGAVGYRMSTNTMWKTHEYKDSVGKYMGYLCKGVCYGEF